MIYKQVNPHPSLRSLIECYWIMENEDPAILQQKIIPDGFPEIIFHYGNPYRINLKGQWQEQAKSLLAGQISKYFFLENTGRSGMVGIKFFPTALRHLFGLSMNQFTNKVVDMENLPEMDIQKLAGEIFINHDHQYMIEKIHSYFSEQKRKITNQNRLADQAVRIIHEKQGMISVSDLVSQLGVGERKMERLFREYVGLGPKLYSRIIRFNAIFQLKQQGLESWSDLVFQTGFYDQAHFIKNFKEFSGDDPSVYLFNEENMANFFLKRQR